MKIFGELFFNSLSDVIKISQIKKNLEKKGILASEETLNRLFDEVIKHKSENDSFNFVFPDDEIPKDYEPDSTLTINVSEGVDELISKISDDGKLEEILQEAARVAYPILLESLYDSADSMMLNREILQFGFEDRLFERWKPALTRLKMLIEICIETGSDFIDEQVPIAAEENNIVFDVLVRLHARACQISQEVYTLITSGFADGAHARWRTLHEIAVMGFFIKENGNETAEKYLLHDNIESYKAACFYKRYQKQLNLSPLGIEEFEHIKFTYNELIKRFGQNYANPYGWAADILGKSDPKIFDIESSVGMSHMRPYYKLASHNIHANPKGIMFRLGSYQNRNEPLLAGPSNIGFTDPAQSTAISLSQITISLLNIYPSLDNLIISNVLLELEDDIGEEFFKIQQEIDEYEERIATQDQ